MLARDGLMAERIRTEGNGVDALNGVVAGAEMLRCDLLRARMILQEVSHAR